MSKSQFESKIKAAQRKAESEWKSAVRRAENDLNREVRSAQRKAEADLGRQVRALQRKAQVDLNRRVRAAQSTRPATRVAYTPSERVVAERVADAVAKQDERDVDVFLSYATSDGSNIGRQLHDELTTRGVLVWFGEVSLQPGKSQARAMDRGITNAHAGVVLLTPAFIKGRFWTERELGALLHKDTVIPVVHGVSFEEVRAYSSFLHDLNGFSTERDSIGEIAEKIARAIAAELADQ